GSAVGLALAACCMPALRSLVPTTLPLHMPLTMHWHVLLFAVAAGLSAGAMAGALPGLLSWRSNPAIEVGRGGRGLRAALAACEVALATILLAGAGVLLLSLWRLNTAPLGIRPTGWLTAQMQMGGSVRAASLTTLYVKVLRRAAALPGVQSVAIASDLPLVRGVYGLFQLRAAGFAAESPSTRMVAISPGYLRLLGITVKQGRAFTPEDRAGRTDVAIVSARVATMLFGGASALGREVFIPVGDKPELLRIVGVAEDVRYRLGAPPSAVVYVPYAQSLPIQASIVLRAANPGALAVPLRRVVAAVNPDQPIAGIATARDLAREGSATPRFRTTLIVLFGSLALLLALAGLIAALSFSVAQRRHEIAVRMALGSAPAAIARRLLWEGLSVAGMGIAMGLGTAVALAQLIRTWLYQVSPADPRVLLATTAALLAASAIASWWPARRAARTDPLQVLRSE
ncbi:MAG: ABC transporter permease, partial [Terriglobales bacterium]